MDRLLNINTLGYSIGASSVLTIIVYSLFSFRKYLEKEYLISYLVMQGSLLAFIISFAIVNSSLQIDSLLLWTRVGFCSAVVTIVSVYRFVEITIQSASKTIRLILIAVSILLFILLLLPGEHFFTHQLNYDKPYGSLEKGPYFLFFLLSLLIFLGIDLFIFGRGIIKNRSKRRAGIPFLIGFILWYGISAVDSILSSHLGLKTPHTWLGPIIMTISLCIFATRQIQERHDALVIAEAEKAELERLFSEMQHRIKNNFMMINGFLAMKQNSINSPESYNLIDDIQKKVSAMADLHEMLYFNKDLSDIFLNEYLEKLMSKFEKQSHNIVFNRTFDVLAINADMAVPIGLIISELIINSIKYAFNTSATGRIDLLLEGRKDAGLVLIYKDNGPGLPEKAFHSKSMGLKLIKGLAAQIGAEFKFENDNGLNFLLFIKPSD